MPDLNRSTSLSIQYPFFVGGGETGKLLQTKNWINSSIGLPENWPQSLRTTISILLNASLPMILYWGPESICFYNDGFVKLIGVDCKEDTIIGMPAEKSISKIWPILKPLITLVVENGISVCKENQSIISSPSNKVEDIFYTLNCIPVNDESGKVGGVLVLCEEVATKISIQKNAVNNALQSKNDRVNGAIKSATIKETINEIKAQKNIILGLSEGEKKFRDTVLQAPVGITLLRGSSFIVETANKIFLDVIGKSEEDFIGKPLFDTLPELKESVEVLLTNIFTTGLPFNATEFPVSLYRFEKPVLCYFNFSCQVLKDDDGSFSGIIVIAYEVTTMVNAKHSLAESEKHFRNMVLQSPIPMAILRGADYIIEMANIEMIKSIWRKKDKDVLGKKILDVFPELKEQHYPEILKKVFTTGKSVTENESVAYIKGDDGMKKFYLDYEYAPLFETDKMVSGIMVTANDVTEKVETRQKLEMEEARLRLATEGTRLATWDLDLETKQIIHSARLAEIFGYDGALMIPYLEMRQMIDPDDLELVIEKAFEKAIKTSVYNYEARVIWHDKTVHWIRTQGKVLYNDGGVPIRLLGTTVDITENKVSEQEIARLAAIVQSSKDAIISENMEGIITSWNEAAELMFGYSAKEIIGLSLSTIIPASRLGEDAEILEQIKKDQPVYSFETQRIKKDKTILDVSLTISPVKDARGIIIGASKIARDITKQKQIEIQIIASEERFRLLANSMPQLIWTSDEEGNFNYYNQAVYDYAGLTFENLQDDGWLQMVHPDDRKENLSKWMHSIITGEDFIFEHRFKKQDGEYRWQLSRAVPQKDSKGAIKMWVGTSTDIHEIKENEQQKDFFISMASHELKTPVTSIKGYVQILMSMYRDKGDDFLNNSLETVNKQIITLTTLIVDLLDLSKIKLGSLQLNKEQVNINELIIEIIKEIQHTEPDCVIEFIDKINATVFIDRGRIGQVLINMLTNAIKYSPNCKDIKVSSKVTQNELLVSVTDAGIGINKTDQQKIFQRFYRVAGKDEKTFPGFGIGLFIASQIIQRHHGKIGVSSEPGKGSVFYFILPLNN